MSLSKLLGDKTASKAMIDVLRNPLVRVVDTSRVGYDRALELMFPHVQKPTRLQALHWLGYIHIDASDSVDVYPPSVMRMLDYIERHPSASPRQIANDLGHNYSYVLRMQKILMTANGLIMNKKWTSHKLIKFYNHMGWLNRTKMDFDADWLECEMNKPPVVQLYPEFCSGTEHAIMHYLCNHPFASRDEILNVMYCAHSTYHRMFNNFGCHRASRVELFNMLGYIKTPKYVPDEIVAYWFNHPDASIVTTAEAFGVPTSTMAARIDSMYKRFGYTEQFRTAHYKRLGFYWYMGWFDIHKLAEDANEQYEALQERT